MWEGLTFTARESTRRIPAVGVKLREEREAEDRELEREASALQTRLLKCYWFCALVFGRQVDVRYLEADCERRYTNRSQSKAAKATCLWVRWHSSALILQVKGNNKTNKKADKLAQSLRQKYDDFDRLGRRGAERESAETPEREREREGERERLASKQNAAFPVC